MQQVLNQNLKEIEDLAKYNQEKKEELVSLVDNYNENKALYQE